jgi:hypothetical protein
VRGLSELAWASCYRSPTSLDYARAAGRTSWTGLWAGCGAAADGQPGVEICKRLAGLQAVCVA